MDKPADRSPALDLLARLRTQQAEITDLLAELATLESPSHDPDSQEPVFELLGGRLADLGFEIDRHPGRKTGGHLEARMPEATGAVQMMVGHCDTVWPAGTLGHMPVLREGDLLYGPGTYDMKAGLTQIVYALDALRSLGLEPALPPAILVNADEEIGSFESTPAIRDMARGAARVFVLEPSLGPRGKLKTSRKGVGRFYLTVKGRAAHAGLNPEEGISAVLELSHVIQALFALNDPDRGVTVNVGQIDGGLRPNVVAPESRAVVDVRVPTMIEARRVERSIHELEPVSPGAEIEVLGHIGRPPLERSEAVIGLWQRASRLANALGIELEEGLAGGGSDGNTTAQLTPTLDGLGAVGAGAHAAHEHVDVARTIERTALLALLLLEPTDGTAAVEPPG